MSPKALYTIGATVGSLAGGMVPNLWGSNDFSFASIIFGIIGGLAGIWLAARYLVA